MSPYLVAAALLFSTPAGLLEMFDATSHEFGQVPHGSVQVHRFTLKNTTQSPIRAEYASSSCRCATPTILNQIANPGENLVIEVAYNTTTFTGPRSMTISVTFAEPRYETIALRVSGYSRSDLTLNPTMVDFGVVPQGGEATRTVDVVYTGAGDWRIEEALASSSLTATVAETERRPGRTAYKVTVALSSSAPAGGLSESLQLRTTDANTPMLPVAVVATVQPPLAASPSSLSLGSIGAGAKTSRNVIIKGAKPFAIEWVDGQDDTVRVFCTEGVKTVHFLRVDVAPAAAGALDRKITVKTDLGGDKLMTIPVTASVHQ